MDTLRKIFEKCRGKLPVSLIVRNVWEKSFKKNFKKILEKNLHERISKNLRKYQKDLKFRENLNEIVSKISKM